MSLCWHKSVKILPREQCKLLFTLENTEFSKTFDFCKLFFFTLGGAASSPSRLVEGLLEILRGAVGVPSSMGDVIELRE